MSYLSNSNHIFATILSFSYKLIVFACSTPFFDYLFIAINFYPQIFCMSNRCLQGIFNNLKDKETLFVNAIMNGYNDVAKRLALNLYNKTPQYLLFFYFYTKSNKLLLLKLLGTVKRIDPHLIYLLLQSNDFSYSELAFLEPRAIPSSFIGLCLKKQFFIKKFSNIKKISSIDDENVLLLSVDSSIDITDITVELNKTIQEIDDFGLYAFAAENGIKVDFNEGINYKWYMVINSKDLEAGKQIILASIDFNDIKRVLSYCRIKTVGNKVYDIIIEFINNEDPLQLLTQYFDFLYNEKSFLSKKILLALLIATKQEDLLLLALYLSNNDGFTDNYEISIINLFLCRYFFLFSQIIKKFKDLEIKNIQIHNFAYVWSDPMILMKIQLTDEVTKFKRETAQIILNIENSLTQLLDKGLIAVAYSSLELRESLKTSKISQEINSRSFVSDSKDTLFILLLGEKCSYLFDKITKDCIREEKGCISTIKTIASNKFTASVFSNQFMDITDQVFITNLKQVAVCFK